MDDIQGTTRRFRVLIGKPGLDGHDRGAKVVARALRDAGMEVVYTGLHQTPAMIAAAAVQEDVDLVGISVLSGAHNHLVPEIMHELASRGAPDIPIFVGGIVPADDVEALKAQGVVEVFGPGARLEDIVASIRTILEARPPV
jgi:methylmalonyl-CoA mutase C-terminal domain/subunit